MHARNQEFGAHSQELGAPEAKRSEVKAEPKAEKKKASREAPKSEPLTVHQRIITTETNGHA